MVSTIFVYDVTLMAENLHAVQSANLQFMHQDLMFIYFNCPGCKISYTNHLKKLETR